MIIKNFFEIFFKWFETPQQEEMATLQALLIEATQGKHARIFQFPSYCFINLLWFYHFFMLCIAGLFYFHLSSMLNVDSMLKYSVSNSKFLNAGVLPQQVKNRRANWWRCENEPKPWSQKIRSDIFRFFQNNFCFGNNQL